MGADWVVAVDVGGTTMKGAPADRRGRLEAVERRPTESERGPDAVVDRLLDFVDELVSRARREHGPDAVAGVGVGVPGVVDERAGVAVWSANLGWDRVPLRDLLRERTGLPAVIGHDVRLGGLAEGLAGAAAGARDYLFVALGTGVGAAVTLNGTAYVGHQGVGGELGHMVVDPEGPECPCGKRGCVEALASAGGVQRRYRQLSGGEEKVPAREVAERASQGDPVARRVWDEAIAALGRAIANYAVLLDPERVVIGGGMAEAGDSLFGPLREAVARGVLFGDPPGIVRAALGEDAGCRGAAFQAWLALGIDPADLRGDG